MYLQQLSLYVFQCLSNITVGGQLPPKCSVVVCSVTPVLYHSTNHSTMCSISLVYVNCSSVPFAQASARVGE